MERLYGDVGSSKRPFEASPEVLDPLSVDFAVDVFVRVIHGFVSEVLDLIQTVIADPTIGVDGGIEADVFRISVCKVSRFTFGMTFARIWRVLRSSIPTTMALSIRVRG